MSARDKAKNDWKKGMKYADIAKKYGVSESTVRSWASRYWKSDPVATKLQQENATKSRNRTFKRGGQKNNQNAVGHGAPIGNNNATVHGVYSTKKPDFFNDQDIKYGACVSDNDEILLLEQIRFFSIRERRIMLAINKYMESSEPIAIDSSVRTERKRVFDSEEDELLFKQMQQKRIDSGELMPGRSYEVVTATKNKDDYIIRFERELSTVQRAKTQAIMALINLRSEKAKNTNAADQIDFNFTIRAATEEDVEE